MNQKFSYTKIKFTLFFVLTALLVYGLSNNYNSIDFDIWARLIQGKHVIQTGSVMYNDLVSYVPTHTWYDPEWLSSVVLYLIINKFGLISLTVTKFILIFLIFCTILYAASYINKRTIESLSIEYFFITAFALFFSGSMGLLLRCQYFSYLILPIWLYLLEKLNDNYESENSKIYMYIIPLVMLFWLNTHGACIAGAGIIILYIIGRIINKKPIKKYLCVLFFMFLMFFINPWGHQYIKFLVNSCFVNRGWIIEWQPTATGEFINIKFLICYLVITMLLYILKLFINKFKNINFSKLFIILITYYLAWVHFKHVPLYVICSSIYMYNDISSLVLKAKIKFKKKINLNKIYRKYICILKDITVLFTIFGIVLYYIISAPTIKNSLLDSDKLTYPHNLVEFIRLNNIKGNMFLPYFYGSYMAYKTYPNIKIFMDGRQEQVYDYDIFDREMYFMYGMYDEKGSITEEYIPDMYFVDEDWEYKFYVENHPDYTPIYKDERYSLYIKKELAKNKYKNIEYKQNIDRDKVFETNIDFRKK